MGLTLQDARGSGVGHGQQHRPRWDCRIRVCKDGDYRLPLPVVCLLLADCTDRPQLVETDVVLRSDAPIRQEWVFEHALGAGAVGSTCKGPPLPDIRLSNNPISYDFTHPRRKSILEYYRNPEVEWPWPKPGDFQSTCLLPSILWEALRWYHLQEHWVDFASSMLQSDRATRNH